MPESKEPPSPLGRDPLEALDRDSLWAFDPAPPNPPGGGPHQSILPAPSGAMPLPMPTPVPSPPAQGNVQKPPSPKPAPSPLHHLVTFSLGAELFGIDIKQIQEIIRHQEVCPVPNSPPYMEGLINLRGRILPVISLRRKLGMMDTERGVSGGAAREPSPTADAEGERPEDTRTRRIIIVSAKGSLIGLLVDSVKEVMHLPVSVVDPPGTVAGPEAMEYIIGVGKLEDSHLLSILDLEKLLADL